MHANTHMGQTVFPNVPVFVLLHADRRCNHGLLEMS